MTGPDGNDDSATARVELAHYAWVTAALAEGFGLDEVLQLERLERRAWDQAELSWRTRLATDPEVHGPYRTHLAEAEDELGGPITPLDDDLEAWVLFLRIYGDHPAPFNLLSQQRLRPGDLARLQRRWAGRLEEDDDLVERAGKLREKVTERVEEGEQLQLPAITVAPAALRPSPYAQAQLPAQDAPPGDAERPVEAAPASEKPLLELYPYAALCAALDDEGADEEAVLGAYGLSLEEGKRLHEAWRGRMDADRALAADFRSLHRHFNEREAFRGVASLVGGGPGPNVTEPNPPLRSPQGMPGPLQPAAKLPLGATLEGNVMAPQVVLPFAKGDAKSGAPDQPERPAAKASPDDVPPKERPGYNPSFGSTVGLDGPVPKTTLPFEGKGERDTAPEPATDPGPAKKRLGRNPSFGSTAVGNDKAPKITLPFRARQEGDPSSPEPATDHADSKKRLGRNPSFGSTAGLSGPVPKATLPFEGRGVRDTAAEARGTEPSGTQKGGSLAATRELAKKVADWKVNHYASLCAELAERPEDTAAIHQRYGLADGAAEAYVHELWQMRFVKDEEARTEWQRLLKEYRQALARSK